MTLLCCSVGRRTISAACAASALALFIVGAHAGSPDPGKVVGAQTCGECHQDEVEAWKGSHHYKTFTSLPRRDKAREIADALGIRRIKAESDCLSCHFTSRVEEEKGPKPISGISCESCHGAAADWVDIHNNLGDYTKETEPAEHREARLSAAAELGMLRPSNLYAVSSNCFSCHTVPNEHLVNVGGHKAGSDFDLVAWSQGEIRHNFVRTNGQSNGESTPEHLRVMYVLGKMLDMEYALRGIAVATKKGDYTKAMVRRYRKAMKNLEGIHAASPIDEVAMAIDIAKNAPIKLNREEALTAAGDAIGEQAKLFIIVNDGSELAPIDALLPGADKYRGDAYQK